MIVDPLPMMVFFGRLFSNSFMPIFSGRRHSVLIDFLCSPAKLSLVTQLPKEALPPPPIYPTVFSCSRYQELIWRFTIEFQLVSIFFSGLNNLFATFGSG